MLDIRRNRISQGILLATTLTMGMMCFATTRVNAQGSRLNSIPRKTYMNNNVIILPIRVAPNVQGNLREVLLYVKDDPNQAWTLAERSSPTSKEFVFKAERDGEYWFTVVTVDKMGRSTPFNLASQPPGAIVVLDRKNPQVDVVRLPANSMGYCVQCKLTDDNPDRTQTKFEYQTRDKIWRLLDPIPGQPNNYCIPSQAIITGMIRVTAADRCANETMVEMHLQDCQTIGGPKLDRVAKKPRFVNPPQETPKQPIQKVEFQTVEKLPPPPPKTKKATVQKSNPPTTLPNNVVAAPKVIHAPKAGKDQEPEIPAPPMTNLAVPNSPAEIINSTRLVLNYNVQEANGGVGRVEVWVTRDNAQTWQRLAEDPDKESPAAVEVTGEGVYGLTLVATNSRGFGGEPPAPGSTPDRVVEVDLTAPQVEVVSVSPIKGAQAGTMMIMWKATDKNMAENPIDLYYTTKANGPWVAIAKGLINNGQYRWFVPREVGPEVYVRIVARDSANNTTTTQSSQPALVDDLTRPVLRIQAIQPAPRK